VPVGAAEVFGKGVIKALSTLVAPFQGWRYNPDKVSDLAPVPAPPVVSLSNRSSQL